MRYILSIILILIPILCYSAESNKIIFYKPYTALNKDNARVDSEKAFKLQYENIKNADPEIDSDKAIMNNDFRFVGGSGVGYVIPGNEKSEYNELIKKYSFKVIAGTSDSIIIGYPPLNSVAGEYARKCNTNLFHFLSGLEKLKKK
jgi:hypothetical protein